jgi:hypothetical protein
MLLLLVDGSSYLYRAFHALPDLRNSAGEPTGAIYGVLNMLRRLEATTRQTTRPASSTPRARPSATTGIRIQGPPPADARRPGGQIEPLHAAKAAGWPLLMVDGVEADDVIGTLARQAAARGHRRGDFHRRQGPDAAGRPARALVNTMSNEVLDEAGVTGQVRRAAGRIVDYLALVGDTVDNVPGVDKVRPQDRRQVAGRNTARSTASSPMPTRSAAWSARTCASTSTSCRWARSWSPWRCDLAAAADAGPNCAARDTGKSWRELFALRIQGPGCGSAEAKRRGRAEKRTCRPAARPRASPPTGPGAARPQRIVRLRNRASSTGRASTPGWRRSKPPN